MAHPPADAELVRRAQAGDLRAYEELYRRHNGWVTSLARRWTGNDPDALDVLQETFSYLWTKLQSTSTLRGWLYPIVKHKSIDLIRLRRRDAPLEAAPEAEAPSPVRSVDPGLEFQDLLQGLSGEHREVVVLRFAHDFRLAEIAEALGIPVGTVKSRLHNALERLRRSGSENRPPE